MVQFERMQEDNVEDAKAIKNYLDEVHVVAAELYCRQDSSKAVRRDQR